MKKTFAKGVAPACALALGFSLTAAHAGVVTEMFNAPTGSAATSSSAAGTLVLSDSLYDANQSKGSVTVRVNRSNGSAGTVTVRYSTADGSAIAGSDYTAASGTLSWANGDTASKSFTVRLSTARPYSGHKSFKLRLASPAGGASLGSPGSGGVSVTGSDTTTTTTTTSSPTSSAARLAAQLGRANRLLVGLGTGNNPSDIISRGVKPDLYDRYLSDLSWPTWNNPLGAYVSVVAQQADSMGAVPMYTLYQMAAQGENNLGSANDSSFMAKYWANTTLLFRKLAEYGKPALVNVEPDFWGFVERAGNGDPTRVPVKVTIDGDCTSLPNNAVGMAACVLRKARKYAPKAYVGFPPSDWAANSVTEVAAFMNRLGAGNADFITMQTLDRDAGCFEAQAQNCSRSSTGLYLDESNQSHPNFHDHIASAKVYYNGIGKLPLLWWQTPMGVPAGSRGGYSGHFRDNREHYFLTHAKELTAVGALGVVFGAGAEQQTTITTDGGQFQNLLRQYFAQPAPLP